MEVRENNVELKAMGLVQEYLKKFRSMDFTIHPANIPGESAGKGSNMAWAVRKLSEKYSIQARKDVIVTGIDGTSSNLLDLLPQTVFSVAAYYSHDTLTLGACS